MKGDFEEQFDKRETIKSNGMIVRFIMEIIQ